MPDRRGNHRSGADDRQRADDNLLAMRPVRQATADRSDDGADEERHGQQPLGGFERHVQLSRDGRHHRRPQRRDEGHHHRREDEHRQNVPRRCSLPGSWRGSLHAGWDPYESVATVTASPVSADLTAASIIATVPRFWRPELSGSTPFSMLSTSCFSPIERPSNGSSTSGTSTGFAPRCRTVTRSPPSAMSPPARLVKLTSPSENYIRHSPAQCVGSPELTQLPRSLRIRPL